MIYSNYGTPGSIWTDLENSSLQQVVTQLFHSRRLHPTDDTYNIQLIHNELKKISPMWTRTMGAIAFKYKEVYHDICNQLRQQRDSVSAEYRRTVQGFVFASHQVAANYQAMMQQTPGLQALPPLLLPIAAQAQLASPPAPGHAESDAPQVPLLATPDAPGQGDPEAPAPAGQEPSVHRG